MPISTEAIKDIIKLLGRDEARLVYLTAKSIDRLEAKWKSKLKDQFQAFDQRVADGLLMDNRIPADIDFIEFYFTHSMAVMEEAIHTARISRETSTVRLSTPPPPNLPRTLHGLQRLWDRYRQTGKVPRRIKHLADQVKGEYLKKCKSVWERYTRDFRSGESFDRKQALKVIKKASEGVQARAEMIVQTETTSYYNSARREVYDQSPDVSHYLFLSIRDQRTTKWCKTRHRLVYEKGDRLTEEETPSIHWNCRSEMVPLSKYNPRHAAIIADKSKWRRNRTPEPLPKEWRK